MDTMFLEYTWTVIVLIFLEGLLSADNALVLAVMVKHLPGGQQKKALLYGIWGAFVFRVIAVFLAAWLMVIWQAQAFGALYLLYIAASHFLTKHDTGSQALKTSFRQSFWGTVVSVELADIAFSVDSILAAVALAQTLPPTDLPGINGLDGGRFLVVITGGILGIITMRFVAGAFIEILKRFPGLEHAAYLLVGWIGLKLAVLTLAHEELLVLPLHLPESTWFKVVFWSGFIAIIGLALVLTKPSAKK